ncbi:hypothetical protein BUALT_Bualt02G0061600 [Buddleja alternifolia]|uniref:RING-type E3 ubiquitin transferase n=1 Tax=Buddleja alternifolia TaxID=168488 RepID=A0AAV6Y6F6_9LAMI|nr:hypothetical protein BUALT_Bualt02G0061600 [Buddleja alternifolia]
MAELLSDPRRPTEDFLSGSSPAATFSHGFGRSVSDQLPEAAGEGGGTVHVAVGKSVEKTVSLLQWSFSTFRGQEICLLHVHRPSPLIPTLLGKLPARQANPEMVAAFRYKEREETMKLLSTYLITCSRSKVEASVLTTEADEVKKGIVNLVNVHSIRKLVVGAIPDFIKGKKSSCKASHTAKHAPSYCEMWFVNKGKLIWTRQASQSSRVILPNHQLATHNADTSETGITLSSRVQCIQNSCDPHNSQNVSSSTSAESEEEFQLAEVEVDELNDEAYLEQKKLVAEAVEALNKVKALEMAHSREIKLRTDAEIVLRITIQEQEKLLRERQKITHQLQKTIRCIALLDSRAHEANCRREEVSSELKLIQASIATLRKEKQKLQVQKIEAIRWLDRWKSHEQWDDANERFMGDISELPEFLLSDLEGATCNFSENFKIGRGGYGIVYKGEMLNKTVAIKKLHSYNMPRQTDFHKKVQVLGKLRHTHLVELIGVCSESWLLVYEYLPGGSLHNYLSNNNNISTLNWKIRARIVADIASALLFLHSFRPKKIVHGNLKPENLLLDSENRCKISDYSDHMLTASQAFRCPSFRHCSGSNGAYLYTDPECNRTGAPTYKSDIYSFGLIVLQLVTGKHLGGLVGEVRRAVANGKVTSVLDSSAGEWSTYVGRRLVELGLRCCECNSRDRPELTQSLVKELEHLPFLEEQTVPSFFLCPILQEIMHDPQVAADGFTYEGEALRGWLDDNHQTSPMTNLKLTHLNPTPNHSLRLAIHDWLSNLQINPSL